ncbi:hypothetical protein WA026_017366, partial [Henosepilachna vigintioctopunctata]
IMPRAQNSHALVNAGFLYKLDSENKVQSANLVFGNINPEFIHATETEKFLIGKELFKNETLQGAFTLLAAEINPEPMLPEPEPEFRKQLSLALFFKVSRYLSSKLRQLLSWFQKLFMKKRFK